MTEYHAGDLLVYDSDGVSVVMLVTSELCDGLECEKTLSEFVAPHWHFVYAAPRRRLVGSTFAVHSIYAECSVVLGRGMPEEEG